MERWPLGRKMWPWYAACIVVFLAAVLSCTACGVTAYLSLREIASEDAGVWLPVLTGILLLILAAVFASLARWSFILCFSRVFFTARGIERSLFGRCQCSIPWAELTEIGILLHRGFSPLGGRLPPYRSLAFADRPLKKEERAVSLPALSLRERGAYWRRLLRERVSFAPPPGDTVIRVECRELCNLDALEKVCPLPIPSTSDPIDDSHRYDLPSFRRERDRQGVWGAAVPSLLPTAEIEKAFDQWRFL